MPDPAPPAPPAHPSQPDPAAADAAPTVLPALAPGLAQRTFGGFAWLAAHTVASKVISFAAQIVLAWLLRPDDFGYVGLAMTVAAFIGLLQQAGVRDVLVQRHDRAFRRWATPAFWMSLALGLLAAAIMVAAAPLAAALYRKPPLQPLIMVLAAAAPLQALAVVPTARLQIDLRFKAIAVVSTVAQVLTSALTVSFAGLDLGAYSFVLPFPIVAALQAAALWKVARVRVGLRPRFRRWRFLAGDSLLLVVSGFLITAIAQGDYVVLGLLYDERVVGLYYYAFVLSMQAVLLLVSTSSDVLFPALSRLRDERDRQARAFLRASRLFMLAGVPLCLWQAAVADTVVRWLFKPEWAAAIPLVQLLSLASSVRLPLGPAAGMIKAQGRFGDVAGFWLWNAALFLALVTAGAFVAAGKGVAAAMLVYSIIAGPLSLRIAARDAGGWREVWGVYAVPLLGGAAAVGAGLAAAWAVARGPLAAPWAKFVVISAVTAAAYAAIVRAAAPAAWAEIAGQVVKRATSGPPSEIANLKSEP